MNYQALFEKFVTDTATAAEVQSFRDWVQTLSPREYENVIREYEAFQSHYPVTVPYQEAWLAELLGKIVEPQREAARIRSLVWRRLAVAASIILVLGLGTYFIFFNKPANPDPVIAVETHDVKAPETNRAKITLADGRTVYLDSAANGELVQQGNIKLVKLENGQIAYQTASGDIIEELQYNTLINPRGSKVIDMMLSDGSHVWLNAGSSITYPIAFVGNERRVRIQGEAYFEVAHDPAKPFFVQLPAARSGEGPGGEVMVLGTHFNVNAYEDEADIKVTLLEGSVKTSTGSSVSRILKPGEQARISSDIEVLKGIDTDAVMAWKNGRFVFGDKADIQTIMRQIARWYDVDVEYTGTFTKHFGGSISRQVNVSEVLKVLEATGGIKGRVEGRKLILSPVW